MLFEESYQDFIDDDLELSKSYQTGEEGKKVSTALKRRKKKQLKKKLKKEQCINEDKTSSEGKQIVLVPSVPIEGWENMSRSQKRNKHKKEKRKSKNQSGSNQPNKKKKTQSQTKDQSKSTIEESLNNYPFEIDPQDHCETPEVAHDHISNFLTYLAQEVLKKDKSELRIYDPYYCEGRVITSLSKLGFTNVYNRCEDFYSVIESQTLPEFDVIVSNPPYSGDHIEKCINFCVSTDKPWFLLLPNFVYMKDYYKPALTPAGKIVPQRVFCIVPVNRYLYWTPKGRHQEKSKDKTSPHVTFWYCHFGNNLGSALTWVKQQPKDLKYTIAKEVLELPLRVLDQNDPKAKKIKNAQKRQKYNSTTPKDQ